MATQRRQRLHAGAVLDRLPVAHQLQGDRGGAPRTGQRRRSTVPDGLALLPVRAGHAGRATPYVAPVTPGGAAGHGQCALGRDHAVPLDQGRRARRAASA